MFRVLHQTCGPLANEWRLIFQQRSASPPETWDELENLAGSGEIENSVAINPDSRALNRSEVLSKCWIAIAAFRVVVVYYHSYFY